MLILVRSLRAGVLALIAAASVLQGPPALGSGVILKENHPKPPTLPEVSSTLGILYACYRVWDGSLLDCAFTHKIVGLKKPVDDLENNGGHLHNGGRPLIDPPDGKLEVDGGEAQQDGELGVKGQTRNEEIFVKHRMPQASGRISADGTLTLPSPFFCVHDCFTFNSWKIDYTIDVAIDGLAMLPDEGPDDLYIKVRGGKDTHPEAYFGTQTAIQSLKFIAQNYHVLASRKLSVNDMSLSKGGMFDLNNQWWVNNTPGNGHTEHRTGTDADINQDNVACQNDNAFKRAVDLVFPNGVLRRGKIKSARLCEGRGFKHIDLDLFDPNLG